MKGTLYGVSVGPGDPGLLTLRAAEVLRACPVIAVPVSGAETNLALEIARQAVPEVGEKELLRLDFPMVHDREILRQSHDRAAARVMALLDQGRDVAMVNLGDASIYATYGYIRQRVMAAGDYPVVTIPGVPSFCAVAARLNLSLTKPHLPLHIIPGGYPGLEEALEAPGTKIVMKAGKEAGRLRAYLAAHPGSAAPLVKDCGLPGEEVYASPEEITGPTGYFSTAVVKEED